MNERSFPLTSFRALSREAAAAYTPPAAVARRFPAARCTRIAGGLVAGKGTIVTPDIDAGPRSGSHRRMVARIGRSRLALTGVLAICLTAPLIQGAAAGDVNGSGKFWPFHHTPVRVEFGDDLDNSWE